jgi:hypothetical protein
MALTKDDLRDFTRFADDRLAHGGADSLIELAGEWEAQRREMDETVKDIRESHADIDSGSVDSVAGAFAYARGKLGRS